MNLTVELDALRNQSRDLPVMERARLCCDLSKRLEKVGEYEKAYEALSEFWPDRQKLPNVDGMDESTKAEVLLRTGSVAGWLGGADQLEGSQETAKNLITKSIEIFESLELSHRVAEARGDLALCYWREGSYDEARITLRNALDHIGNEHPELKSVLLIRSGIVEVDSRQFNQAFHFYNKVVPLLERSEDDALKGSFHISFAVLFRRLATTANKSDYLDQALIEYAAASFHFEQAGNIRAVARVENNLGFLYFTIDRYKDAHRHLDRARNLFNELKDIGPVAQVDETRARTLVAEGHLREAERLVKMSVRTLDKGGQHALLSEALMTHGTVLARMGNHPRARALLQRAIDVAETCGDLEGAGRARLSIIEELYHQTSAAELSSIFHAAADLLANSQDPSARQRLITSGSKVIEALMGAIQKYESPEPTGSWQDFSLRQEIKKIESRFIEQALRDAGGSVSKASRLLGFKHHQSLISLLGARHQDLQDRRSIKRKRNRHLITGKRTGNTAGGIRAALTILHVEQTEAFTDLVQEILNAEGVEVDACTSGSDAWEILKRNEHYDAVIVDNKLPAVSGLELVLRVRSTPHRRNLPLVMLSADDCEKEAWRAGVDAFLRKSQVEQLTSTISRIIDKRGKS
jgi:CheY-like chemotaxis protein